MSILRFNNPINISLLLNKFPVSFFEFYHDNLFAYVIYPPCLANSQILLFYIYLFEELYRTVNGKETAFSPINLSNGYYNSICNFLIHELFD